MNISINKAALKRISTYLNIASVAVGALLGLNGVIPPEAMTYIVVASAVIGAGQAVTVQLGELS